MKSYRQDKLADLLKQRISDIIRFKMKDPRIGFITVTHVKLSSDCRHARIYVSVYGSGEDAKSTLEGLESAKGFIRTAMGSRIRLRYIPQIEFVLDDTMKHSMRIGELLKEIKEEDDRRSEGEIAPEHEKNE